MKVEKINLGETGSFSPLFLDYIEGKSSLKEFYHLKPDIDQFEKQIAIKGLAKEKREILHKVLIQQYEGLEKAKSLSANLQLLKEENTYTITTGHQLNIFSGPLYFIYKIVTVINTCKKLQDRFPDCHFVPVYWMASEDHDFEEINHFHLWGKKYQWETSQSGAVGRYKLDSSLHSILSDLPEKVALFEEAYGKSSNLAEATRHFSNQLFGDKGLVVLDADSPQLKSLFKEIIQDDLLNHRANDMVESTSTKISDQGYKVQVYPRAINFFYLDNGTRERWIREDGKLKARNTDVSLTEEEAIDWVNRHPEKFSPNVILRPLYQELILPNLAYIGGSAEIAYWLQLKKVFDHYQIPFPILLPRNFALILNKGNVKKLEKFDLKAKDLFLEKQGLKNFYLKRHLDNPIELEQEIKGLNEIFDSVKEKAATVDKSLEGFIGAEAQRSLKSLENIQKRLHKAEEQSHEISLKQIEGLKEKLFPQGRLQERWDNFLNFYINNPEFIQDVINCLDPFDFRFHILIED